MIKKTLLLAGILAVFSTTKAHPATDNDTIEVVYADTTGIDIDSIETSIDQHRTRRSNRRSLRLGT